MTEPTPEPSARARAMSAGEIAAWCRQLGVPMTAELLAKRSEPPEPGGFWDRVTAPDAVLDPGRISPACPVCGAVGMCERDDKGRALIHSAAGALTPRPKP